MDFVFTFFVTCLLVALPALAADSCPSFGTEFDRGQSTTRRGLWLNFDTPSQCNGTATEWRFCYFVEYSDDDLELQLLVYRKDDTGEYQNQFEEKVTRQYSDNGDLDDFSASCDNGDPPFCCETLTLTGNDMYSIQKNDIVGVCMRDSKGHDPLYSLDENAPGHAVYAIPDTDSCGGDTDSFSETDVGPPMNGFGIHVYLEVNFTVPALPGGAGGDVAIGIVIATMVIIGLIAMAIATSLYRIRRSQSTIATRIVKNQSPPIAISNVIYDVTEEDTAACAHSVVRTSTPPPTIPLHYETADAIYATLEDAPEVFYSEVGQSLDYRHLIEQVKNEGDVTYGDPNPYCVPAQEEDALYYQIRQSGIQRIARESIEITGYLGSGEFGNVNKGTMRTSSNEILDVAVKTLTGKANRKDKVRFLQEGAIMAQFKHPNVVKMYGVVKSKDELLLIIELLPKGDLQHFLVGMRPDPGQIFPSYVPKQFVNFCQQIALGMQYLSMRGFVHRDLAARNILMSASTICKIGDFGMSRDLADGNHYVSHGGKIPVKWTAPEAIQFQKYSTASDVWSYGCLLYEIWSVGHKPFEDVRNAEVVRKVGSGYRLPPPPGCPRGIYDIMLRCWHPDSSSRPPFRDLLIALLENEDNILEIPSDALSTHRQAGVLGAPLEAGEEMYRDLQQTYK